MALTKVSKSTLEAMAKNLAMAAKHLRKVLEAMPERQSELLCEAGTRETWARGFRKWAFRLREEQDEQLQMLDKGMDLDAQKNARYGRQGAKKPAPTKKSGKKSRKKED